MEARVIEDERSLEHLKQKEVLLLFGCTGSGKSTLANALISKKDNDINIVYSDGLYRVIKGK